MALYMTDINVVNLFEEDDPVITALQISDTEDSYSMTGEEIPTHFLRLIDTEGTYTGIYLTKVMLQQLADYINKELKDMEGDNG